MDENVGEGIQSKALYPGSGSAPLAVAGFYGLSCFPPPPELWAMCFPSAKAFEGVRMKPELLPALPRRVVGWVYAPIVFAQTSLNLS